jgi:hypothetical protein
LLNGSVKVLRRHVSIFVSVDLEGIEPGIHLLVGWQDSVANHGHILLDVIKTHKSKG